MTWTHHQKSVAWNKAFVAGNNEPKVWWKDECGAWMNWGEYGNRDSQYGWEVDHINSKDHGGADADSNLRALQWENNASKGAGASQVCCYGPRHRQRACISWPVTCYKVQRGLSRTSRNRWTKE